MTIPLSIGFICNFGYNHYILTTIIHPLSPSVNKIKSKFSVLFKEILHGERARIVLQQDQDLLLRPGQSVFIDDIPPVILRAADKFIA